MNSEHHFSNDPDNVQEDLSKLHKGKRLLNPMDRAAEILFGLIMALTFTCSIGIANSSDTQIRQLLIAAISCNLAWGLVDATMYLIGVLADASRTKTILNFVRNTSRTDKAKKFIADALPSAIAAVITNDELESIRKRLASSSESSLHIGVTAHDLKNAVLIFLLVFISTFPVVIPFLFIRDTNLALRVSNLVAIVSMFFCGWSLAKYVGANKWIMSISMTFIGIILVFITVVLGG